MAYHPFSLSLLSRLVALSLLALESAAHAQTTSTDAGEPVQVVEVRGSTTLSGVDPSAPYPGGEVTRGARVGVLGDKDGMSTPFAITGYTNDVIQNRQARSVGDVLLLDPSVRVARGFGNAQEAYFIRGFILSSDSISYNGLYSVLPRQYVATELFDRVEVLRGASAFLDGASPGGDAVGGSINLVPKRAPNNPLTEVSFGLASGSQTLLSTDIARRFGPDESSGVRIAGSSREGGTGIDGENAVTNAVVIGLDWHSRDLRLSADLGHQDNRLERIRTNVTLGATATAVPVPPDAHHNWAEPWSYSGERATFGTVRAEYDISATLTAWIAAGGRRSHEANSLANLMVSDSGSGAATTYRFDNTREDSVNTGELGMRTAVRTGSVGHSLVVSATAFRLEKRNAYAYSDLDALSTNLYDPSDSVRPDLSSFGNALADPKKTDVISLASVAVADTLSLFGDTTLVTLGARRQRFDIRNFAYGTGTEGAPYEQSRTSPVVGAIWKVNSKVSVYGNYIQALAQGDSAPTSAVNFGAQLAPYISRQKEVGVKVDLGSVGGSAAIFSTSKPRSQLDASNVFTTLGEDRHQGLELSAFGLASSNLRILGGAMFIDARQRGTGDESVDGKRVIGTPTVQASMDVEWDVPYVNELSLDARVIATSKVYADSANRLVVPAWTRLDIGARYVLKVVGHDLTFRARVDNVGGRSYWASSGGYPDAGYLVLGSPRTLTASATASF